MNRCKAGDKLPKKEDVDKMMAVVGKKHRYLFKLAGLTGFRISELLNLSLIREPNRNYVDFETGKIVIGKQKNGRVNEPFFLFPELESTLKEYIKLYKKEIDLSGGWLFWSRHNGRYKRLSRSGVLTMMCNSWRKKAGLTEIYGLTKEGKKKYRFTMHSMRHYAINYWGKKFVQKHGFYDTNSISCLSRHSNPASLDSYKVLCEDIRKRVVEDLLVAA
jgi:integrase